MAALPPFAPFPEAASWRRPIAATDWAVFLDSWLALVRAHLALPDAAFAAVLTGDEDDDAGSRSGLVSFLASLARAQAVAGPSAVLGDDVPRAAALRRAAFLLAARALHAPRPPAALLQWPFLSDLARAYGRGRVRAVLARLSPVAVGRAEASLSALKKTLIRDMEAGKPQPLHEVDERLRRANHLLSAWPAAAALFLAGTDLLDAMVVCFRATPVAASTPTRAPLRRTLVTTTYVTLIGLTEGPMPRYSLLSDVLYALRAAAQAHLTSADDSLVAELVTATPVLRQLRQRAETSGASTARILPILKDLAAFQKPGRSLVPPPARRVRRGEGKGKDRADALTAGTATATAATTTTTKTAVGDATETADATTTLHAHKLSQISQIQDLFPDLGSAFVAKLLDEYADNTEQAVAHLLEDTLPPHLQDADRSETLPDRHGPRDELAVLVPRATPPSSPPAAAELFMPDRHNVYDDDELDGLSLAASRLHFGRAQTATTADDMLRDRARAPNKAAILSALAAFDADDDERDDTYDAADVGAAVDADADDLVAAREQALFTAYQAHPDLFARTSATRRADARVRLRDETGMTDEALEGWAIMLERNPQQRRRLEARFGVASDSTGAAAAAAFSGAQTEIARTAWRANDQHNDNDSGRDDSDGGPSRAGAPRGRGRGRGRGGRGSGAGGGDGNGGSRGNVAGPTDEKETEQARRRKEANKSSRANHNRRDQRARKMARSGFPG